MNLFVSVRIPQDSNSSVACYWSLPCTVLELRMIPLISFLDSSLSIYKKNKMTVSSWLQISSGIYWLPSLLSENISFAIPFPPSCIWFQYKMSQNTLGLCLVPGKCQGKKKNTKENYFLIFGFIIENMQENKIELKLVRNLCTFKLFIFI